jgi:hypothetical protein
LRVYHRPALIHHAAFRTALHPISYKHRWISETSLFHRSDIFLPYFFEDSCGLRACAANFSYFSNYTTHPESLEARSIDGLKIGGSVVAQVKHGMRAAISLPVNSPVGFIAQS